MKISQAYHRIQVILILTFTQLASLSNHDCASYLMNSLRMWPLCLRKRVTGVWMQNCLGTMLLILLTIPPLQRGAFLQCANGSLQKFIMQHIKILHSELVAMLLLLKHWSMLLIHWRHYCHYFYQLAAAIHHHDQRLSACCAGGMLRHLAYRPWLDWIDYRIFRKKSRTPPTSPFFRSRLLHQPLRWLTPPCPRTTNK